MQIHSTNHYRWQASLLLKKRKEKKPVYGPPARGFEGNSRSPEGEFTPHAVNACRCILPPTASSLSRVSTCAPRRYRKMITGWKFGCNCYDHLPAINHSPPLLFPTTLFPPVGNSIRSPATRWESGWIMIREQTEIFSRGIDKLLASKLSAKIQVFNLFRILPLSDRASLLGSGTKEKIKNLRSFLLSPHSSFSKQIIYVCKFLPIKEVVP